MNEGRQMKHPYVLICWTNIDLPEKHLWEEAGGISQSHTLHL